MTSDDDLDKLPISDAEKAFLASVREQYESELASHESDQSKPPTDK